MGIQGHRFIRLSRVMMALAILLGTVIVYGQLAMGQGTTSPGAGPAVRAMTWPNGVELLAGLELDLDAGEYEWRVSTLDALPGRGSPFEVGAGVVVAVSSPVLVERNGTEIVRLENGAALVVQDDETLVVMSASDQPAEYLVVELVEEGSDDGEDVEVVGPLTVRQGQHALVLLNLPIAVAIDYSPDQVIEGSLRPAVSIAHTETGIPTDLSTSRNYDRWIVALYPPIEQPVATTVPTNVPQVVVPPTSVPATPTMTATPEPTATATDEPTATATDTPTATATDEPTATATEAPTATATDAPPTATTAPTATATEEPE